MEKSSEQEMKLENQKKEEIKIAESGARDEVDVEGIWCFYKERIMKDVHGRKVKRKGRRCDFLTSRDIS